MQAKKSLGQNFLMHPQIAERIADVAELAPNTTVLEIGPGTGMLTRALLERVERVVAVEADAELVEKLHETFPDAIAEKKLELIHADIRAFSTDTLPRYAIVANIPYYLTGEILRTFLSARRKPSSMTLLVQKEVAERITGRGSSAVKKESLLSLSVKVYGKPEYCFKVPRGAFRPAPKVDSAVVSIREITNPFASPEEETWFFTLLHAGFSQKRKMLAKNLETVAEPSTVKKAFETIGLSEKIRSEDLSLIHWQTLAATLRKRQQ